jgi:tRNA threonylcarbamoyladenosine biosynthesis protein TsaE
LHVRHFAVKSVIQPGDQSGFGRRKVDAGHPDLGESELAGPLPYPGHHERTVVLSAGDHHLPILESGVRTEIWRSEDDTRSFAQRLATHWALADAFIELHGDLGAGKTTLVRHLLRALGIEGRIKSPTYAVVEPHDELPGRPIWHFDFYRFNDPREWEDAGFRDIFAGPGLKLVEWPDKARALLPPADLVIRLEALPDESRLVTLRAATPLGQELLA